AASHLRRGADLGQRALEECGVFAVGLVRREHVVVRRDNADMRPLGIDDCAFFVSRTPRHNVREVAAADSAAARVLAAGTVLDAVEIAPATGAAALDNTFGYRLYAFMYRHAKFSTSVIDGVEGDFNNRATRDHRSASMCPPCRDRYHPPDMQPARTPNCARDRAPNRSSATMFQLHLRARTASGRRERHWPAGARRHCSRVQSCGGRDAGRAK